MSPWIMGVYSITTGLRTRSFDFFTRANDILVLYQYDTAKYGVTVVLCNKTQHVEKGHSLFKYCNAVAE
ncbi:hypothetical protein SAMN05421690_1002111 [Nitrosomonas sp. Nm51]|nr:hypothetical protein SAMN05421690_1002111 [Nitrosomonas sp. Nm51]